MIRKVGASKDRASSQDRTNAGLANFFLAPVGGAVANIPMSAWAMHDMNKDSGNPGADSRRVANHMKKKYGLKTKIEGEGISLGGGGGPHFDPSSNVARVSRKGPSTMAHELGHAVDLTSTKNHRPWVGAKGKMLMRAMGPGAGLLAGSALLASGEKPSQFAAPAVAAGYAPMLWQEGKASVIGIKNIKEVLGRKAARAATKDLAKAFGTYGAMAGGTAAVTHLIRKKLYPKNAPSRNMIDKEKAGF